MGNINYPIKQYVISIAACERSMKFIFLDLNLLYIFIQTKNFTYIFSKSICNRSRHPFPPQFYCLSGAYLLTPPLIQY